MSECWCSCQLEEQSAGRGVAEQHKGRMHGYEPCHAKRPALEDVAGKVRDRDEGGRDRVVHGQLVSIPAFQYSSVS